MIFCADPCLEDPPNHRGFCDLAPKSPTQKPLQIREKKVQSDQNYRTGPAKNNQKNVLSGTGEIMSLIINY